MLLQQQISITSWVIGQPFNGYECCSCMWGTYKLWVWWSP